MPRPPRWAGLVLALTTAATAATTTVSCGDDGGSDETGLHADSGAETEGEGPPHPSFIEPASDRLSFASTRSDDLELKISNVIPGVTELVVDGRTLGPLGEGSVLGQLDASSLRLHVRGAMITGQHRMVLRTSDATGSEESETIAVSITADTTRVPIANLPGAAQLVGHRLLSQGHDKNALLLVLEWGTKEPLLHLLPFTSTGWDASASRTLALPGLVRAADERVLPIAALRYDRSGDDPGRIRVAWRVGSPGERIDVIDTPWETAAPEAPPRISLRLDDGPANDPPAEWTEFGRPWLLADLLLAERWAPLDVESPRPGDRALIYARVHDRATGLDPAQRLSIGADLVDLDRLGPAVDAIAAASGRAPPISIRVDQRQAIIIEHDRDNGTLRARDSAVSSPEYASGLVDLPLATVLGAFGSRSVADLGLQPSDPLRVSFVDDLGEGGVQTSLFGGDDDLDFSNVTGEITPTSIDGMAVFLVPFGPDEPVIAVYGGGEVATIATLPDLHCDSVAVASSENLGAAPLACASGGEVWLGTLTTATP